MTEGAQRSRERLVAPALLVIGGGLALVASAPVWIEAGVRPSAGLPIVATEVSGRAGAPLVPAVGLLALAGAVVALLAGPWVRRVIGVVVAALAVAAMASVLSLVRDPVAAAASTALDIVGFGGTTAVVDRTSTTVWPLLATIGCALCIVGGAWLVVRASAMGGSGRRFERAGAASAEGSTAAAGSDDQQPAGGSASTTGGEREGDPVGLWDALDRGEDPTG